MMYRTHAHFGAALFPVLCGTWGVTLSRKRLIRGSVKPDFSSLFLRYPHFWKHSRKYVEKKIRKLERMALIPGKKNGKFSENLGIVLHYVADYFTAVHNVSPNPVREHVEYETRLHALFLESVDEESLRTSMRLIAYGIDPPFRRASDAHMHGTKHQLRYLRDAYRPNAGDPDNDVRFITIACLTVTARIMGAATKNLAISIDYAYVY